jgi:hypothetical protein
VRIAARETKTFHTKTNIAKKQFEQQGSESLPAAGGRARHRQLDPLQGIELFSYGILYDKRAVGC